MLSVLSINPCYTIPTSLRPFLIRPFPRVLSPHRTMIVLTCSLPPRLLTPASNEHPPIMDDTHTCHDRYIIDALTCLITICTVPHITHTHTTPHHSLSSLPPPLLPRTCHHPTNHRVSSYTPPPQQARPRTPINHPPLNPFLSHSPRHLSEQS